jgi:hypothetical protein
VRFVDVHAILTAKLCRELAGKRQWERRTKQQLTSQEISHGGSVCANSETKFGHNVGAERGDYACAAIVAGSVN